MEGLVMRNKYLARAVAVAGLVVPGAGAMAVTQGSPGVTSTGRLVISMTIPPLVRISGLTDINLGSYTGTGNLTGVSGACVRRNGVGTYSVTATSTNTFRLAGPSSVPYTVTWGGRGLNHGEALLGRAIEAASLGGACGANSAEKVGVTALAADLQGASAGAYTDTVTLVVASE